MGRQTPKQVSSVSEVHLGETRKVPSKRALVWGPQLSMGFGNVSGKDMLSRGAGCAKAKGWDHSPVSGTTWDTQEVAAGHPCSPHTSHRTRDSDLTSESLFPHSHMAKPEFWVQTPTPALPTCLTLESEMASLCPGSPLCQMETQESSPLGSP